MKHTILLSFIVFLSFSCSKDADEFPTNPGWLNDKIEQMKDNGIPGMAVYAYRWKDAYFYHIMNPISSCWMCEFYSYDGSLYQFGPADFDDFNENAKMVKVVWEK
jgi:hypothetical protein